MFNFVDGKNIGQRKDFGGFNDIYPLPVLFKDMFPEKLQTITVNFDGTPGMGFNQFGKITGYWLEDNFTINEGSSELVLWISKNLFGIADLNK